MQCPKHDNFEKVKHKLHEYTFTQIYYIEKVIAGLHFLDICIILKIVLIDK